jgi:hypothetical protein
VINGYYLLGYDRRRNNNLDGVVIGGQNPVAVVTQHLSGISQAASEVIHTQNPRHIHLPNIYATVDSA